MWALGQLGASEAIPLLLDDLSHPEATVRLSEYNYFKAYFLDFPPPYDLAAGESTRLPQVSSIREWYSKQKLPRSVSAYAAAGGPRESRLPDPRERLRRIADRLGSVPSPSRWRRDPEGPPP